uniref:Uncharacterized protein n=1 Tax=Arundo donax TaxID=35708 RepID=A0A0A8ZB63_ARUDO
MSGCPCSPSGPRLMLSWWRTCCCSAPPRGTTTASSAESRSTLHRGRGCRRQGRPGAGRGLRARCCRRHACSTPRRHHS